MPQTVPSAAGYSPSFDYSTFQFDLSLLPDDYGIGNGQNNLKSTQIKQEACSPPRPCSPITITPKITTTTSTNAITTTTGNYPSPNYTGGTTGPCELPLSPNYSHENSPGYPTSPYYVPRSPQSAQFYPTSPEPPTSKQPIKREKSLDLLAILQESR